jgi:hypothetical protein
LASFQGGLLCYVLARHANVSNFKPSFLYFRLFDDAFGNQIIQNVHSLSNLFIRAV